MSFQPPPVQGSAQQLQGRSLQQWFPSTTHYLEGFSLSRCYSTRNGVKLQPKERPVPIGSVSHPLFMISLWNYSRGVCWIGQDVPRDWFTHSQWWQMQESTKMWTFWWYARPPEAEMQDTSLSSAGFTFSTSARSHESLVETHSCSSSVWWFSNYSQNDIYIDTRMLLFWHFTADLFLVFCCCFFLILAWMITFYKCKVSWEPHWILSILKLNKQNYDLSVNIGWLFSWMTELISSGLEHQQCFPSAKFRNRQVTRSNSNLLTALTAW